MRHTVPVILRPMPQLPTEQTFHLEPSLQLAYEFSAHRGSRLHEKIFVEGTEQPNAQGQPQLDWLQDANGFDFVRITASSIDALHIVPSSSHGIWLGGLSLPNNQAFGIKCVFTNPQGPTATGDLWAVGFQSREGTEQDLGPTNNRGVFLTLRLRDGIRSLGAPKATQGSTQFTDFPVQPYLGTRSMAPPELVMVELVFDPANKRYEGALTVWDPCYPQIPQPLQSNPHGNPQTSVQVTATLKFDVATLPPVFTTVGVNVVQARSADTINPVQASVDLYYFQLYLPSKGLRS